MNISYKDFYGYLFPSLSNIYLWLDIHYSCITLKQKTKVSFLHLYNHCKSIINSSFHFENQYLLQSPFKICGQASENLFPICLPVNSENCLKLEHCVIVCMSMYGFPFGPITLMYTVILFLCGCGQYQTKKKNKEKSQCKGRKLPENHIKLFYAYIF